MKKLVIITFILIILSSIVFADKILMKVTFNEDLSMQEALEDPMFYHTLGDSLFELGEYDESITAYQKSLSIKDTSLTNHNLGVVYYTLNDYGNAANYFIKSLTINPEYELSNYHLGLLRFHQNNYEESILLFRKTILLNPENYQAHFDLAISLVEQAKITQNGALIIEAYQEFLIASKEGIPNAKSNAKFLFDNFLTQ